MTSCELDLPPEQPLAGVLFLQEKNRKPNIYFAELHIQKHIILQK